MAELSPVDRRALQSVAVQFFVNGAVVASYVPRLPEIRSNIDASLFTIGWVLAVSTIGGVIGASLVGRAIDELRTKPVMLMGASILILMLPLLGFVNTVWQLLLVLVVIHASDVLTDVAMNVQGSALSARRTTPVMNRLHAMWSLGTVVGGVVATMAVAVDIDLRWHLAASSVVLAATLAWVAPGLLTKNDQPNTRETIGRSSKSSRVLVIFGALGAAAIVPEMINSDWAAFRVTEDLDAAAGAAGLAYVAWTVGMVAGRMGGDWAAQRFGHSALLRYATGVAVIGIIVATLIPALLAVYVGLVIAGLGVSVMFPELYDAAAKSPGAGRSLGAMTAGSRIAMLFAPAVVGFLADLDALTVGQSIAIVTIPMAIAVLVLTPSDGPG